MPTNISLASSGHQIVGQSLTLECSVTTVRGITSRMDIVWSSDGELKRVINITTMDDTTEYVDLYTIKQLNDTDQNRMYQCEVVINSIPPVKGTKHITLEAIGSLYIYANVIMVQLTFYYLISFVLRVRKEYSD